MPYFRLPSSLVLEHSLPRYPTASLDTHRHLTNWLHAAVSLAFTEKALSILSLFPFRFPSNFACIVHFVGFRQLEFSLPFEIHRHFYSKKISPFIIIFVIFFIIIIIITSFLLNQN